MHLNSHTGRNVHACPYCNIQFTSRSCYEGHIRSHTDNLYKEDLEDDISEDPTDADLGPQIVSVQSISPEESGRHNLPMLVDQPKTSTILQVRPLNQMTAQDSAKPQAPSVTYTCSFCNGKQTSQEDLIKHLGR